MLAKLCEPDRIAFGRARGCGLAGYGIAWTGPSGPGSSEHPYMTSDVTPGTSGQFFGTKKQERWPRNFEQGVKWNLGLTAGMFCLRIRSDDEEASPPESHTGLQGEGGPGCPEERPNDCAAC